MSIVERDRAAAWFAERDGGAQVLLCSEIGSEGRNFQFAHHLVLLDLPENPDLLEQKIGRLDRIGQSAHSDSCTRRCHNPGSRLLFRWYHEGLDAFRTVRPAGHQVTCACAIACRISWKQPGKNLQSLLDETHIARPVNSKLCSRGVIVCWR